MITQYRSTPVGLQEIPLDLNEQGTWIRIIGTDRESDELVAQGLNLPMDLLRAAFDEEERSRIEIDDGVILIIINTPLHLGEDKYDTLPLGLIITGGILITVSLEENEILNHFVRNNIKSFNTGKPTRFIFQILHKTISLYLKMLSHITRRTDEIENELSVSMQNRELFQMLQLGKSLIYFENSLRGNQIVTEKLIRLRLNTQVSLIPKYEEDEDILEDVVIETRQALEMVQMYSAILNGMTDAFASIISNNVNIVMKFLTLITVVLSVPTMVASFWGMNVNVPWGAQPGGSPMGFWIVLGLALMLSLILLFTFWKKRSL
ncbi:MAG: magnesium transporter CorA family protein [Candidatus Wallbacteria bacterium]|nr:magnesium transporter CorA family protein [Candidatus Wallbacteria bacterium]